MATAPIQWRTPEMFPAGDTLLFNLKLPNYLPSDGWAVQLTVSKPMPNGAQIVAQLNSTPSATNDYHSFNVNNFLAEQDAGIYVLTEEVVNAGGNLPLGINAGEKHQIYFSDNFQLLPDLADGAATGPVQTTAQEFLAIIKDTLKDLYKSKFAETDVQRNRFVLQKTKEALQDWQYWMEVRNNEIQMERARNGKPPGNVSQPIFCVGA